MISSNDAILIRNACAQFSVPVPKAVATGENLHEAATQLLEEIRAEVAPNLEGLNLKNLRDTHAQMVARTTWQTRERAAVELEATAVQSRILAWHNAAGDLVEAFRVPFDSAAGIFRNALETLNANVDPQVAIRRGLHDEYRALTTSAEELAVLAIARNCLAASLPFDSGRRDLDSIGRIISVPDTYALTRRIPAPDGRFSLAYWVKLAAVPGVIIKWHAPGDQQVQHDLPANITGGIAYTATAAA